MLKSPQTPFRKAAPRGAMPLTFLALMLATAQGAAFAQAATESAPQTTPLSLERIHADPPLMGRAVGGHQLSPGGRWLTYLKPSERQPEQMELWGRALPSGADRRLASAQDILQGREERLTEAEKMALERRRQRASGVSRYFWCGQADDSLILALAGDLYRVDVTGKQPVLRLTQDENEPERDPACDEAGRQLAYVKKNDLWVQSLEGGAPRQLTRTGSPLKSTGLAEFVVAEEFSRHKGFWWSPDGRQLLALEVDESGVQTRVRAQIGGDGTRTTEQRYPFAGTANAKVRPLLLDVSASTEPRALTLPQDAEYIVRAGWFADGKPWLQWMPRDQKRLQLVEFDGVQPRIVIEEQDPAWVEVHDDLKEWPAQMRSGRPGLLWSSERSGRKQLLLVDRVTGKTEALTQQAEPVDRLLCVDGSRLFFTGATERGRGREVFLRDAQGRVMVWQAGESRRWRDARTDQACSRMVLSQSAWQVAPRTELWSLQDGSKPVLLSETQPEAVVWDWLKDTLKDTLKDKSALTPELMAADSRTALNAVYLPSARPGPDGRSPLIVRAYGGPGSATVSWRWLGDLPNLTLYRQMGFAILMLDTRGMAYRDRDYTRAHHMSFGKVEVADVHAALKQLLGQRPELDPTRVGFTGWSYGGYLAARLMLDDKSPFAAAIAGAAPTDWTLYDTAYTERYLGMPEGGKAAAYAEGSLLPRAKQLSKPLLLIHGTADDNVLFENSLKLINALQREGKLFETAIYPGHAHGIAGREPRLHLARTQLDFFVRHLKPAGAPAVR